MNTTTDQLAQGTRRTDPDTAKSATDGLSEDAAASARDLGETVAQEARGRADRAKTGVADDISSVSQALRRASDDLREGSPQERSFGAAASALADFSDTIRDKDMGQMVDDLSDFARRNPMAFLGGAALLGFAGVRMAKASQRARLADDGRANHGTTPAHATASAGPVTATGTTRDEGWTGPSEKGEHS